VNRVLGPLSSRSKPGRLEMLGELMREATPTGSRPQHEGRTRLVATVEKMRRRSRTKPALGAFAFAAANAAAVLVVLRVREAGDGPIAWHVENGTASARGYVSVPLTASTARLVFGDGSDVALAPGSRGRVAGTTSVGAKVVLEQGRARVHVQHREQARWLVEAGPFAVRVKGTDSLVAWSTDAETLDVWTRSGRVEVTGPVLGDALSVSAGQHLRARLGGGIVQIDGEAEPPESVITGFGRDPSRAPCLRKASSPILPPTSRDPGSEPCAVR
jgi:ferric-dicitrate binding protein FerR (iron transport regulator)